MKQKNNNLPLPLRLVKQLNTLYPSIYNYCDDMLEGKGKDLPEWDSKCVIPIAATLSISSVYASKPQDFYQGLPAMLQAIYSWRIYKEIYTFDENLRDLLFEQADDIVIPTGILFSMPYPCIYIECSCGEYDGFFCCFEQDMRTFEFEFRITLVNDHSSFPLWLHLSDGITIKESIEAGIMFSLENITNGNTQQGFKALGINSILNQNDYEYDNIFKTVSELLQLILYICADNAEIDENTIQKEVTRKPQSNDKPKDVFREIRKWDVGSDIGYKIRKYNNKHTFHDNAENKSNGGVGSKKRPHTRRGHWHHYWIGGNDNRKLILKWTAPMFVNGDSDDTITTINKIE